MDFKKHKFIGRWPYLATIFGLLAFLPSRALAIDGFTRLVGDAIWSFFVYPMIWALELELELLKLVARYNDFTNEVGVTLGWIALRDLSNMFFILILLVIAFATILRISSYGYQQLLKHTIIIAILINFSKTIVGFVIDVAQIIMLTFISAVNEIMTGGVVVAIGLQKFTTIKPMGDGVGYDDYIVSLVMGALLVAILLVIVGVMLMMLMMRIVALWVAIILAPLAFVASIFPATKSFYNTWLKQLGANLVSGPMLAFFLWLTFSIVGNGEAYRSFIATGGTPSDGATEFLGTTNLVNYIVAISLLLTGVKVAASSGAAGASFASKGMGLMQKTAGKLYRRYPKALGMRVASGVAGRVVDSEGNLKRGFKTLGKVPFYGGRLQRGAMGVKGRNAARIMEEKAEDEKYILPQHKVVYEKTYGAGADSQLTARDMRVGGFKFGRALDYVPGFRGHKIGNLPAGKIYSKVGSWGGDKERQAMMYQNMLARGEINATNADKATDALRDMGDEAGMQKIQANYWTFKDKREAMRLLEKGGLNAILNNVKTDNLYEDKKDADGNVIKDKITGLAVKDTDKPKVQALYALDAIFDPSHGEADHNAIAGKLLALNKVDRWAVADIMEKHFDWRKYLSQQSGDQVFNTPEEGIQPDKRGILGSNLPNPAVMAAYTLAKVYPQKLADRIDEEGNIIELGIDRLIQARAAVDLKNVNIKPGQIADRLYQWHGEDNKTFGKRKNLAASLDLVSKSSKKEEVAPWIQARKEYWDEKGKFKEEGWKEFNAFRQDIYKQTLGLTSWTFDPNRKGEKRIDYNDSSLILDNPEIDREHALSYYAMQYVLPQAARKDLRFKKETLAKETESLYQDRKKVFAKTENPEEYERRYNKKLAELKEIDNLNLNKLLPGFNDDFGEDVAKEIKQRMMAEIVGDNRKAHNWASKSFWTEVQDGANGSRLMEVNVGNDREAAMLDHAIDSSENQQQSQAFQVATSEQTEYLLNKLVELGKQPQKVLMENTPTALASRAQQKFDDIKAMRAGILADDLNVLGPDLRKLTHVLLYKAKQEGITLKEFLNSEKSEEEGGHGDNGALKKVVDNLNNIFKDQDVNLDYENNTFHYLGKSYDLDKDYDPNKNILRGEESYRVQAADIKAEEAAKKAKEKPKEKAESSQEVSDDKRTSKIITQNLEEEFRQARKQK